MAKQKLNIENIHESKPTKSIVNLLYYYRNMEGLEQKYIRYALDENYATKEQIRNDLQVSNNIKKIKEFYDREKLYNLEFLYKSGLIERGCINSRSKLDYYLSILTSDELGLVRAINKNRLGKITTYKLDEKYREKMEKLDEIDTLNCYPMNQRIRLNINPSEGILFDLTLYGIDWRLFEKKDLELINKEFIKLNDIIWHLDDIKHRKLELHEKSLADKWLKKRTSKKLKKLLKRNYPYPFSGHFLNNFLPKLEHMDELTSKDDLYKKFGLIISSKTIKINLSLLNKTLKSFGSSAHIDKVEEFEKDNTRYIDACRDLFWIDLGFELDIMAIKEIIDFLWDYSQMVKKWLPEKITIFASSLGR